MADKLQLALTDTGKLMILAPGAMTIGEVVTFDAKSFVIRIAREDTEVVRDAEVAEMKAAKK